MVKNGHAYFKKFNYQLAEHHLKPNPVVEAIWIYNPNGHATAPYKWWAPKGHDIPGRGDVYNEKAQSIEMMRSKVIQSGWTAVTAGTNGHSYYKKFDH